MKVDIDAIKRKMLVKYPLFGSVVANLDYVEARGLGTAGTDGNVVYYDPGFMSTLSEDEQTFIMAHEVCHVALDHIFRSEGRNKRLWNIATDAVINAYLKQDGLKMVEGGVDIPEAINYDAEEMYQKLLDEKKHNNNENSNQSKNSSNNDSNQSSKSSSSSNASSNSSSNNDVGHDTHGLWDDAIKKKKEQEQKSSEQESKSSESQLEGSKEQDKKKESFWDRIFNRKKEEKKEKVPSKVETPKEDTDKNSIEEQIKEMAKDGEKKTFKQNKVERKKQLEELKQSLASQSTGFGNSTNSEYRNINDIGFSKPLVDWRIVLREAVNIEVDWSYGNATVEAGIVTPRLEDLPKPETEIVLDTSGSIDSNLLKNFLRECKNILQTSKVKVGCFDTKFYGFNEIRNQSDINSMKFQGGGGTDFNVAISAFSNRVENKIIFTDGQAPMPNNFANAIWIVFGNQKISPKGGKVIYISNEQLERLSFYDNDKGKTR